MNELIKIEEAVISNERVNTVNARELHSFLGVKSEFNHWVKDRLAAGRFALDKDYLIIAKKAVHLRNIRQLSLCSPKT